MTVEDLLRQALLRLKKNNSLVSLRSVAAQVGLSPSYLSKVFRGERTLSAKGAGKLVKALQMDHHEVAEIQRRVLTRIESKNLGAVTGVRTLGLEEKPLSSGYAGFGQADFWLLEEWFHLAILNLATTEGFEGTPEWIAARLGISAYQAERSLQRSIRHGYLARAAEGKLSRTQLKLRFPTQRSHASVRAFHLAMGKKALQTLREIPSETEFRERLISGVGFAGDPGKLPEAKLIIEEALYKAAEVLAGGRCTEVFQMNLQLFKLTGKQ